MKRTAVAFAFVAIASAAGFGFGWHYGLEYQGMTYTVTTALISLVCSAVLALMLILSRRTISLPFSLA